jgi:UDP-N-acetylglucosamine 2-epimerase (non-hydrolysing)
MTSQRDESLTVTSSTLNETSAPVQPVLLVFGTRPEAIKLCPLIPAIQKISNGALRPVVCVTAQHREMLDQVLRIFEVKPDFDLEAMRPGQSLPTLTARLLTLLSPIFEEVKPAMTVVQGDTTTTFCAALASNFAQVPVAHVEAGLRTHDRNNPFPEEMFRVLTADLTRLHFAATQGAARNLIREGINPLRIEVTGNTGIDAVLSIQQRLRSGAPSGLDAALDRSKKLVVVTAHRRESFGPQFDNICQAVLELSKRSDVQIVWPVHKNPNVLNSVERLLRNQPNIVLLEPLDYLPFVDLMSRAYLLLTDSGGIQEEAPSLGKPVLVLRSTTERPEAVEAGTVKLVGTETAKIVSEAVRLIENQSEYDRMSRLHNPYGDGQACERIAERLRAYLTTPLT